MGREKKGGDDECKRYRWCARHCRQYCFNRIGTILDQIAKLSVGADSGNLVRM